VTESLLQTAGADKAILCIDVGYSFSRIGLWDNDELSHVRRWKTPNQRNGLAVGDSPNEVRNSWLSNLVQEVKKELIVFPHVKRVGVSFAGVISADGQIMGFNAIWGRGDDLPQAALTEAFGRETIVVNDLSAATYRYAFELGAQYAKIVVVSVSSGIGCKTFLRDTGRVVIDDRGRAGEIGLAVVNFASEATDYSSGLIIGEAESLKGLLGGYASGTAFRSVLQLVSSTPDGSKCYQTSLLRAELMQLSDELDSIDRMLLNEIAIKAFHKGDEFVSRAVQVSAAALARVLHIIILYDAPPVIIICGGFANALGEVYRRYIVAQLNILLERIYLHSEIDLMIRLGMGDDSDCLIGVAKLISFGADYKFRI
jgi:predicted NBD/HSP70 family sugar kinase